MRLAARMPAGILTPHKELDGSYCGVPLCVDSGGAQPIMVVGIVELAYQPTAYQTGAVAVESLGEAIGPNQAGDFVGHPGPVYFYDLSISEYYGPAGQPQPQETPALQPQGADTLKGKPEKTADLSKLPTELLHAAFVGLDERYQSGVTTADMPPEQMREHGLEIFGELQKRVPHIKMESPLLTEPEPPGPAHPVTLAKVSKSLTGNPDYIYVLHIVMEPNDGEDGAPAAPDYDDEIYNRHAIRKLAFPFIKKSRRLGLMHEGEALDADDAYIVQTYVVDDGFTVTTDQDKVLGQGVWLLGAEVRKASVAGQKIESGEAGAWSIQGLALKKPEKIAA